MKRLAVVLLIGLVSLVSVPCFAKIMSFKFSGNINDIGGDQIGSAFIGDVNFAIPATFRGTVVIDTAESSRINNLFAAEYAIKSMSITLESTTSVLIIVRSASGLATLDTNSEAIKMQGSRASDLGLQWGGSGLGPNVGNYSLDSIGVFVPKDSDQLELPSTARSFTASEFISGENHKIVVIVGNDFSSQSFAIQGEIDALELVDGDLNFAGTSASGFGVITLLFGIIGLCFRRFSPFSR